MTDSTQNTGDTTSEAAAPTETKSTRQMTFTVLDDGTIRAEFGEGIDPINVSVAAIPEAIHAAAMTEGLISRLRGYTSKLVGEARTPASLRTAVAKGAENLLAGLWKIERAPGEGTSDFSIEVEAAFLFRQMRAKAKGEEFTGTLQESADNFAKLSEDEKKTLKGTARYQLALAEVKAARSAAKLKALTAKLEKEDAETGF